MSKDTSYMRRLRKTSRRIGKFLQLSSIHGLITCEALVSLNVIWEGDIPS